MEHPLQTMVDEAMARYDARSNEMRAQCGQINLGQLIELLERRPTDESVVFDFGATFPTGLDSWRGVYAHLALGYADHDTAREGQSPRTVGNLLAELRGAVGKQFQGYKGGEYTMGKDTPLWVANYGNAGGTAVTGVTGEYVTVITTAYIPY